jgi:membrane protease YdiL (CAAX protease family)
MELQTSDYAIAGVAAVAGLASLAILFHLFQRHIEGRPLLEYEPRRPAPWNFLAPLVMLAPLALSWGAALLGKTPEDPSLAVLASTSSAAASAAGAPAAAWLGCYVATPLLHEIVIEAIDAESTGAQIWAQAVLTLTLALGCYVLLTLVYGAPPEDLGLPTSWRQFRRDIVIGATACLASLAPIYMILLFLNAIFAPEEGHPLVQELLVNHSMSMMLAAAAAAVVAAPIYEETAFRLALQGWLEKVMTPPQVNDPAGTEVARLEFGEASKQVSSEQLGAIRAAALVVPPVSWAPVIISSVLFGLAHLGHGVSPLPLMLLGGVLGYLYRQTHRVVPSMACHMLFNTFTFVMLGLKFALP